MAVLPGFLLGGLMFLAVYMGWPLGWYAAARQAHGHAQLMGWGGAMILGVGLQFLPRLRGAKLWSPHWVPPLFVMLALGMTVRIVAQPLAAALSGSAMPWLVLLVAGTGVETVAVIGLLVVLVQTLRQGPALGQKAAFAQIVPMLAVAGGGLVVALGAWTAGTWGLLASGGQGTASSLLADPVLQNLGVATATFVFVPALCLAMSARVFPLFFRIRTTAPAPLNVAAWLLAGALAAYLSTAVIPPALGWGIGAVLNAAGLLVGAYAIQVFTRRVEFPGDKGQYRTWADPHAVGALTAYAWAVAGALALAVYGLYRLGIPVGPHPPPLDLAIHALGAGFMTLLIIGVGPVLLSAFAGSRPAGGAWLWAAVITGNAAALLRTVFLMGPAPARNALLALAGLLGAVSMAAFALCLWVSVYRRTASGSRA